MNRSEIISKIESLFNSNEYKYFKSLSKKNRDIVGADWSDQLDLLEYWGKDSVWQEVEEMLMYLQGTVLDIGCGTGTVINSLTKHEKLELYGCEVSKNLIDKCIDRGIEKEKIKLSSVEKLDYSDNDFDYSCCIGVLQYLDQKTVIKAINEMFRVTKKKCFIMVPVCTSKYNHGLIYTWQAYNNNNTEWWLQLLSNRFRKIEIKDSLWKGEISSGRWFICSND